MDLRTNKLRRNKKGIIFTMLAVVMAIFFTVMFSANIEKPVDRKVIIVESRINVLNDYMNNFFDYTESIGSIAGYSALQGVITDIANQTSYNANFDTEYVNCTRNGYLVATRGCPNMANKTLLYYLSKIQGMALNQLNINSSYKINYMSVNQTQDPFLIEITTNITINITDSFANLSATRAVISPVTIEGLRDPLYMREGTYNQTIKKTNISKSGGEIGGLWNYTDLQQLFLNHEYKHYFDGISFINRIKGNLVSSYYGIESFVNHSDPTVGVTPYDSMVDYLYWLGTTFPCTNLSNLVGTVKINETIIPGGPAPNPWFQLEEDHRNHFNISSDFTIFTCP